MAKRKLNQYVVELWHEPGISPLSSMPHRKMANHTHSVMPKLIIVRSVCSSICGWSPVRMSHA